MRIHGLLKQPETLSANFKRVFGANLFHYWSVIHGFDLIRFDEEFLQTPAGTSTRAHVLKQYGPEGGRILTALMVYK
jgi:hypothetical protein